jgi:hypothetical protein
VRPRKSLAGALLAAPALAGAQPSLPRQHDPKPTVPAVTAGDLMTRLYVFADDSMLGREAGTEGNRKGNAYIASELRRLGLSPAGDNGSFLQAVPLVRRAWDTASALSVDGQSIAIGTDVLLMPMRGTPRSIDGAQVVYGGVLGDTANLPPREQLAGRIVVVRPQPGVIGVPRIRASSPYAGAAAVAVIGLEELPAAYRAYYAAPSIGLPAADQPASQVGPVPMMITRRAAERLLGGGLLATIRPGTVGKTVTGRATLTESPAPAYNVVAVLRGSDPKLRGQYVALGAHNDHVGVAREAVDHDSLRAYNAQAWRMQGAYAGLPPLTAEQRASIVVNVDSLRAIRPARRDSINNGADDDGSGSMALLEIAEALARGPQKPKRSVLFVWHTGEEKGLLGARHFTDHPTVPRDSIVAQLNIDMIGRGGAADTRGGGPTYLGLVGSRRLSSELGDLAEAVNRSRTQPLAFDYALDANGHPENIYCRSDHYEYARYGIPIVFFFTGLHGDYHQVTDEPQYIDYPHYANITQYIGDLTLRVANLGRRPVVDKPKPDPNGVCRQ